MSGSSSSSSNNTLLLLINAIPYLVSDKVLDLGASAAIFKATRTEDFMSVVIKIIFPTITSENLFRREEDVMKNYLTSLNDLMMNAVKYYDSELVSVESEEHGILIGLIEKSIIKEGGVELKIVKHLEMSLPVGVIIMSYVPGRDLGYSIFRREKISEEHGIQLISQIMSTLVILHNHGIVHRDIKPLNIMTNDFNKYVLIDFGFAFHKEMKSFSVYAGTRRYVTNELLIEAVEQKNKKTQVNVDILFERYRQSDLFALGITMYELMNPGYTFVSEKDNGIKDMETYVCCDERTKCGKIINLLIQKHYLSTNEMNQQVESIFIE